MLPSALLSLVTGFLPARFLFGVFRRVNRLFNACPLRITEALEATRASERAAVLAELLKSRDCLGRASFVENDVEALTVLLRHTSSLSSLDVRNVPLRRGYDPRLEKWLARHGRKFVALEDVEACTPTVLSCGIPSLRSASLGCLTSLLSAPLPTQLTFLSLQFGGQFVVDLSLLDTQFAVLTNLRTLGLSMSRCHGGFTHENFGRLRVLERFSCTTSSTVFTSDTDAFLNSNLQELCLVIVTREWSWMLPPSLRTLKTSAEVSNLAPYLHAELQELRIEWAQVSPVELLLLSRVCPRLETLCVLIEDVEDCDFGEFTSLLTLALESEFPVGVFQLPPLLRHLELESVSLSAELALHLTRSRTVTTISMTEYEAWSREWSGRALQALDPNIWDKELGVYQCTARRKA